jgi:hypothetical protein
MFFYNKIPSIKIMNMSPLINIFIKNIINETITLSIPQQFNLKKYIVSSVNTPVSLVYKGHFLKNDLISFNNNDTIYMFNRVRGGIPVAAAVTGGPIIVMSPADLIEQTMADVATQVDAKQNLAMRIVEKVMAALKISADKQTKIREAIVRLGERATDFAKAISKFAKTMAMVARFYPIIIVALIILAFFGKPLEYIMLFIAAIIVSILWVIVYIFGLPVVRVIPYIPYNIAFHFIPFLAFSIVIFTIFVVVSLFCLILAGLNVATSGSLQNMILCQNGPEAWYQIPNYHLDNIYKRSFFCVKPCNARYEPDGDSMCKKMYKAQPAYCPPAEIMRIYSGYNKGDRNYYFKDFNEHNIKYLKATPENREKMLRDHYIKKVQYLDKCSAPMAPYSDITLNICANLDNLEKSNTLKPKQLKKLRDVCFQGYCNSKTNYPFCAKRVHSSSIDMSQLIKQICKIIAIIIVFFLIIIFMLKIMYLKNKN